MSGDMLTTAESGREADRLVSRPWTVRAFIAGSVATIASVGGLLGYMLLCSDMPLPRATGIAEMDILALARESLGKGRKKCDNRELIDMKELVDRLSVAALGSAWRMTRELRNTRFDLIRISAAAEPIGCPRSVLMARPGGGKLKKASASGDEVGFYSEGNREAP